MGVEARAVMEATRIAYGATGPVVVFLDNITLINILNNRSPRGGGLLRYHWLTDLTHNIRFSLISRKGNTTVDWVTTS
ncbi:hypothetical protein LINGRAHAP2_LOCUS25913, partial [Linum grandiflorum]